MTEQQHSLPESPAPPVSPVSASSFSTARQPFWHQPERILAVLGAIGLRACGMLSEEWTATVLLTAMGGELVQNLLPTLRKTK